MTCHGTALTAIAVLMLALPAQALTYTQCNDVVEFGMVVKSAAELGNYRSGVIVESYTDPLTVNQDGVAAYLSDSIPELHGFNGTRVTHCPSGRLIALPGTVPDQVRFGMAATEFLRAAIETGGTLEYVAVQRAAETLFQSPLYLTETVETCACASIMPGMWLQE